MHLTFLGAAGTVTGSKYLIEAGDTRLLVDCGLFQGFKHLRRRNWTRLPIAPERIDAVVLTHAHIDHSGWLPVLVRDGFRPVYATAPTCELCELLLRDSAHLQEEDAEYANRKGTSRHHPALPLYTTADAEAALKHLEPIEYDDEVEIGDLTVKASVAGHILGAASLLVSDGRRRLLCSGDIGRSHDPLMPPPAPPPAADVVLMESTYGARRHPPGDPVTALAEAMAPTLECGGVVLLPAFAVGRAQNLLYCIDRAITSGAIPPVPVYLDSPMAGSVTDLYRRFHDYHRLDQAACEELCTGFHTVTSVQESKGIDAQQGPQVVVSASGMLTGGRVLHHLRAFAGDERNLLLLPGYQSPGTRGGRLVAGERRIRVHGSWLDIRAEVRQLDLLSAHGDQAELLAWLGAAAARPELCYLVHGEAEAADTLRMLVEDRYGIESVVPEIGDRVTV